MARPKGSKNKNSFGAVRFSKLGPQDILSVTPGWRINKRRYLSFKRACEAQGKLMREVSNMIIDEYIREVFGDEYMEKMYEMIKADNEAVKATKQHEPYVPTAKEWF